MEQINAIIDIDPERLDFPLRTLKARQAHMFVALFRRVPSDVSSVFLRVFKENGAYFDITAHEHQVLGVWSVRIPAACFPSVGDFEYELHATSSNDEPTALGAGRLSVASFSYTTSPIEVGTVQEVAQLPCEGGGFVQVVMKWDGYEWMPEAVKST